MRTSGNGRRMTAVQPTKISGENGSAGENSLDIQSLTSKVRRCGYFFFPPSSAMYMISCLKMNRLGKPSRVRRIMFLS